MLLFGNILLIIATLSYLHLCNMLYFRTIPGGDAVVGHAWSLLFGVFFFFAAILVTTAITGYQGGFSWVASSTARRTLWVLLALLVAVVGNGVFMFGEYPQGLPVFFKEILRKIPAVIPLLMIIGLGVLINNTNGKYPAFLYQIPLGISLLTGVVGMMVLMRDQVQRQEALLQANRDFNDKVHQDHLNQIDTTNLQKDFIFLLVFTDGSQDKIIREKALAKIKTRSDWEDEMIRRLYTDWAPEVFTFLSSNEVDHPEKFVEPVAIGARIQAKLIRESIRRCRGDYDLYAGSFSWEVLRMLRTIERYSNKGVDYRPLVQEVLQALEEPTDFKKPKLEIKEFLEHWLKQHQ